MKGVLFKITRSITFAAFVLSALLAAAPAFGGPLAEMVTFWTQDKVALQGLYYAPAGPSNVAVIHVPGLTGSFFGPLDINSLAEQLQKNGYIFLTMNLRTAGLHGMLFGVFEDYVKDIAAAVEFVKKKGATDVILMGHSLGGPRSFYYLVQTGEPAVKAVILSASIMSPYLEAQIRWNDQEKAQYEVFLKEQREKAAAGKGKEITSFMWFPGRPLTLSAATWVNMFGTNAEMNASTVKWGKEIRVPVFIVHGTKDSIALPPNADRMYESLVNAPKREMQWVEGADHFYIRYAEQFGRAVTEWVVKNFPARRAQ